MFASIHIFKYIQPHPVCVRLRWGDMILFNISKNSWWFYYNATHIHALKDCCGCFIEINWLTRNQVSRDEKLDFCNSLWIVKLMSDWYLMALQWMNQSIAKQKSTWLNGLIDVTKQLLSMYVMHHVA